MHQYIKFFLISIFSVFMTTHVVEAAATTTGASEPSKAAAAGGAGASTRPVVSLTGFDEAAVRAYFADPAKKPDMVSAYLGFSSAPVPEEDSRVVLAELIRTDSHGFLNGEAYPTNNLRALFNQLYRMVPYMDALMAAYLKTQERVVAKPGVTVRPVLPTSGELTASDKARLGRDPAKEARAEVDAELTRLRSQVEAAERMTAEKVAAEVARTKAAEAAVGKLRETHGKELEALRTTLTGEISALRARLTGFGDAEARLRAQIVSLEEGITSARAAADAAAAKAAEEIALVAKEKAENAAVRAREAEVRVRMGALETELATARKQVEAFRLQLDDSNKARAALTASNSDLYARLGEGTTLVDRLKAQITGLGAMPVK